MNHTAKTLCIVHSAFCIAALAANAADIYVSHLVDGGGAPYYAGAPTDAVVFDDLQSAVNSAAAGDTVWVEDGFVCDSGATTNNSYGVSRIHIGKAIAIRARGANLATPPVIRGRRHSESVATGTNSIRCVAMPVAGAVLEGLVLEGGTAQTPPSSISNTNAKKNWTCGGGLLGVGFVTNCVIAGCQNPAGANGGGGASNVSGLNVALSLAGCVITNNVATYGGGLYNANGTTDSRLVATNCVIAHNLISHYGGGAYYASLSGCDVADNTATNSTGAYGTGRGGGLFGGTATGCRIFGNVAYSTGTVSGYGGGASDAVLTDCLLSNNWSSAGGGGFYNGSATRCRIIGNRTIASGGGATGWSGGSPVFPESIDCVFEGNYAKGDGGGMSHANATRCVFTNNWCQGGGGGANWGIITDCIVVCNIASNTTTTFTAANGGGFSSYSGSSSKEGSVATNCLIAGNIATGGAHTSAGRGNGGGAMAATLVGCIITNNISQYRGGGCSGCTTINCLISDNTGLTERGGGAWKGSHYNAVIARNACKSGAAGVDGYSPAPTLVNCTVTGNNRAGVDALCLVNTVIYGNNGTDKTSYATNSCVTSLATITSIGPGNTTADPKLGFDGTMPYVPLPGSPCLNKGMAFDWMKDVADIRSSALNGRKRIVGPAPDIGACEAHFLWQTIICVQ